MDVKDRAARVDVLSLLSPAAKDAADANVAPAVTNGGFADSLQKSQGRSVSKLPTESKFAAGVVNPGAERPSGRNGPDESSPEPWTLNSLTSANSDAAHDAVANAEDVVLELPLEAADDVDLTVQQLLTALAVANSVLTPKSDSIANSAPAGLVAAISVVSQRPGTVPDLIASLPETTPMPVALQAALAAWKPVAADAPLPLSEPVTLGETTISPPADANSPVPAINSESQPKSPLSVEEKTEVNARVSGRTTEIQSFADIAGVTPAGVITERASLHVGENSSSSEQADVAQTQSRSLPRLGSVRANPIPSPAEERADPAEISAWPPSNTFIQGDRQTDPLASQPRTGQIAIEIVDQLQPVLVRAASTQQPLSILLRPPELGAVRIDISQQGGLLSARLEAELPAAHRMLTESLPQLRDALTPLGVAPEQIQVVRMESPSAWESGRGADAQSNAGTSGQHQETPSHYTVEPEWTDEPERDDRSTPMVQSRTAINLKI